MTPDEEKDLKLLVYSVKGTTLNDYCYELLMKGLSPTFILHKLSETMEYELCCCSMCEKERPKATLKERDEIWKSVAKALGVDVKK